MPVGRILVVEDEANIAYVVTAALELTGFDVVGARTGREALKIVAKNDAPDMIILDVMLPDLDGFEICRRLRSERNVSPVLFLTALDSTEDRVRGLTIGGDDYLTKPFSVEELIARVRVILRRIGMFSESRVLTCGGLELNDEAHWVALSGRPVDLSLTEYKVLRFLLGNAGRVLTRAQILDHVWNYDFRGESTVVETFVSSLRKKLGVEGARLIQTVRGVGYRLSEPGNGQ
jgi:two-component system OmpR family response regulator